MLALIGSSGFVGTNLKKQYNFSHFYNSSNIQDISNYEYETVFCAAPSAIKWKANKEPAEDLQQIYNLVKYFKDIKTKRFILFSTVDVYNYFPSDEDSVIDITKTTFYGKNRFLLENFVMKYFNLYNIIRLPGLFGEGLKKNIIFDLLNDNINYKINANDSYQWFYLKDLSLIINKVIKQNISIYNVSTESITNKELVENIANKYVNFLVYDNSNIYYDMKTKYGNYLYTKTDIFNKLNEFINL